MYFHKKITFHTFPLPLCEKRSGKTTETGLIFGSYISIKSTRVGLTFFFSTFQHEPGQYIIFLGKKTRTHTQRGWVQGQKRGRRPKRPWNVQIADTKTFLVHYHSLLFRALYFLMGRRESCALTLRSLYSVFCRRVETTIGR